jgi:hypothetical protein
MRVWEDHFNWARAALGLQAIQHLGNEAGLPEQDDLTRMKLMYGG